MQHKNYAQSHLNELKDLTKRCGKNVQEIRIGASKLSQNKKVPAAKVARKELLYIR